jgi:hypothetical protein
MTNLKTNEEEFEIYWKSYKAGYPSYQEVADWWLTKLSEAHRAGAMEAIEALPPYEHPEFCKARGKQFRECLFCLKQSLLSKFTRKE